MYQSSVERFRGVDKSSTLGRPAQTSSLGPWQLNTGPTGWSSTRRDRYCTLCSRRNSSQRIRVLSRSSDAHGFTVLNASAPSRKHGSSLPRHAALHLTSVRSGLCVHIQVCFPVSAGYSSSHSLGRRGLWSTPVLNVRSPRHYVIGTGCFYRPWTVSKPADGSDVGATFCQQAE